MKNILKVLLFLFLVTCVCPVNAQKLKDFYVSYPQPSGKLFHVFPVAFFQHKTEGDLVFDITYQCGKDSAVINFTYYAPQADPLDSIRFVSGKVLLAGKAERLYVEANTVKKWEHRYSLKVPVNHLYAFFNPVEKASASLYVNAAVKDYELKRSEWNKKAPVFQTIMKTIRLDCGK